MRRIDSPLMDIASARLRNLLFAAPLLAVFAVIGPNSADASEDRASTGDGRPSVPVGVLHSMLAGTDPANVADSAISQSVVDIYAGRKGAPIWWDGQQGRTRVDAVVQALKSAVHDNGLVAQDYPFAKIDALAKPERVSEDEQVKLDVLVSLSVARYAQQVRNGRLDPRAVNEIMDYDVRTGDLARSVRFVAAGNAADRLRALEPSQPGYQALRSLLKQARIAAENGGWDVPQDGTLLRPGDRDDRVPSLRRRLAVTDGFAFRPHGDLQSPIYDERLEDAVRRFQARHGLDVDGLIGGMTRRALAVTADDRVRQLEMNLERWRWLPDYLGHDHFLVNVPDYHVEIVEEGELAYRMPVVVGKIERKTPIFSSRLTWLEVNPTWTVPERIAEEDLLPQAIADPNYFFERKIRMYSSWREGASQMSTRYVNWENMGDRIRRHRLRQEPGPTNPLGRVKFMMSNDFSIYLHDSNEPDLFDKSVRHLSSGCVRVADPRWLTGYLLDRPEVWSSAKEEDLFGDWETKRISLKKPMPIHLAYFTGWIDDDGAVQYRDDIYGFDTQMAEAWDLVRQQPVSLAALR